jgi:hypothetical protein
MFILRLVQNKTTLAKIWSPHVKSSSTYKPHCAVKVNILYTVFWKLVLL